MPDDLQALAEEILRPLFDSLTEKSIAELWVGVMTAAPLQGSAA
jgi:hypothetical protein